MTDCQTVQNGETFLSFDGYLHIITSTSYHGTFHHDTKYWQMDYAVYDVKAPGAAPRVVHHKPMAFTNPANRYFVRMTESTKGNVYILAMPYEINGCEIWRETVSDSFEYELVECRNFSGSTYASNSLIKGNSRNGSVIF